MGEKLQNSDFVYDKRHPIFLCDRHHLSKLVFINEHKVLLHAGPQELFASIREKYWVTQNKILAKQIIRECVQCQTFKSTFIQPTMRSLPKERDNPNPPYYVTGLDYAGPFIILNRKGRGAKSPKFFLYLNIFQ